LTGITNEMVAHAPHLQDVLESLDNFISDATIVGHNIPFDLSFFKRHKLFAFNETIDTYEMASVLLPGASRYNLGSLAQALAVLLPATHRALDDALATHGIFLRLHDLALELPGDILAEIVRLSEPLDWGGYWGFQMALQARSRETIKGRRVHSKSDGRWFESGNQPAVPLQQNPTLCALDPDEVAAVLEFGGVSPTFSELRVSAPTSRDVTRSHAGALGGRHLMVEAGTGVGKSMAYLVPATFWALQNNTRVVVSTNTINLQDQLINKDIPDLRDAMGINIQAAVLKGRSNYLCPRRLDNLRRRGPQNSEQMRVLGKILVWQLNSLSGDRSEINLNGPTERDIWLHISAEDEGCTTDTCLQRTGGACPFYRARQEAQSAHVLIVNHALLLADVATGNRVLPEFDYLIVDEAHHIEDATTNALSYKVTYMEIERVLRELGGPNSATLGWALGTVHDHLTASDFAIFDQLASRAADYAFQFENLLQRFSNPGSFLLRASRRKANCPTDNRIEFYPQLDANQPGEKSKWPGGVICCNETVVDVISRLAQAIAELIENLPEQGVDLYNQIATSIAVSQKLVINWRR
jgi:DNA polymerase-3 subunit epsilon/ATP-dependent DNA helicase DinG